MKKLILSLILSLLTTVSHASSQDSLDIKLWDFDAIKASHQIYTDNKSNSQQQCPISLETISWIKQQHVDSIFSSDNCFIYTASKDGWISKIDSQSKKTLVKIRVALKISNTALSKDNKILLVGNRQPADLVFLNADDLTVARIIPVKNRKGIYSPVAKVRTASDEQGFIVAPQDFPKIWKISYQNPAPIGFGDGWNHDYRCLKEHVNKTLFPVKRLKIGQLLDDFQVDSNGIFLVGRDRSGKGMIMDLDLSRVIAHPKIPNIESGLMWDTKNANNLAVLDGDNINIYSNKNHPKRWKKISSILIKSAITVSSCPNSPALWVSTTASKIQIINKRNFKVDKVISLKKPITHISCLQNGTGILMKNQQNELLIFDKQTFQQIF